MINPKRKGNAGEHSFARFLQENGIQAYKNSSSGGNHNKGDIHTNLTILGEQALFEVKTVQQINLKECWYQVNRDASLAKAMPILAVHLNGMPKGTWLMVQHSHNWIHMVKSLPQEGKPVKEFVDNQSQRDMKYAVQNLITSAKKVLRLVEDNE